MNHTWKDTEEARSKNVFNEEKNAIWREMNVENKSSHRWSTRAISPLTSIVVAEETHVDAQKNGKG